VRYYFYDIWLHGYRTSYATRWRAHSPRKIGLPRHRAANASVHFLTLLWEGTANMPCLPFFDGQMSMMMPNNGNRICGQGIAISKIGMKQLPFFKCSNHACRARVQRGPPVSKLFLGGNWRALLLNFEFVSLSFGCMNCECRGLLAGGGGRREGRGLSFTIYM
jgi:hypothetical protein